LARNGCWFYFFFCISRDAYHCTDKRPRNFCVHFFFSPPEQFRLLCLKLFWNNWTWQIFHKNRTFRTFLKYFHVCDIINGYKWMRTHCWLSQYIDTFYFRLVWWFFFFFFLKKSIYCCHLIFVFNRFSITNLK
jgi:hypothetical protein